MPEQPDTRQPTPQPHSPLPTTAPAGPFPAEGARFAASSKLFEARMKQRNQDVLLGLVLFALGIVATVVVIDLIVVVWLGSSPFLSESSLIFMAWVAGIILAASIIQFLRFSRDGRTLSSSLGGKAIKLISPSEKELRQRMLWARDALADLCQRAGCRMPSLYVQQDRRDINAFACGMKPSDWCITLTKGAALRLDDQELKALLAHELAHLTTRDTHHALLVCAYLAGLASITSLCAMLAVAVGDDSKEGVAIGLIALVIAFIGMGGWLAAQVLEAFLSRRQEYRADAEGVRLLQRRDGMVMLLRRLLIDQDDAENLGRWESFDAFCTKPLYFGESARAFWFDSHPPLLARIRALDPSEADRVGAILVERGLM